VPEQLLTPSKITAWIECSHSLSLATALEAGQLVLAPTGLGSLAEVLVAKGGEHERNCLVDLENDGREVYHVPGRNVGESFDAWVARVRGVLDEDHDVLYQMPFIHDGIRGIADFVWRVPGEDGLATYEPVDAKLTRLEGKPGHVLQLCFYVDALEAATGRRARNMHLWLGSGVVERLAVDQFRPYWRRLQRQLRELLARDIDVDSTKPSPCTHCEICEFAPRCEAQWRAEDSLVYVANIRPADREALEGAGVESVAKLARRVVPVEAIHDENLHRLQRQAHLQVVSRVAHDAVPTFEVIEAGDDPVYGHGFELLPAPDVGDVFFDFEGHPFWHADHDLFFLAGLYYQRDGEWTYDPRWAHDLDEQARMIDSLVDFFAQRRQEFPGYHVYHYNHTERSALERLTRGSATETLLSSLVETGLFVDLYAVVRNAVRVGTESYGLKYVEKLAGFVRSGEIEQGAGAVVEYEHFMRTADPQILESIAGYNEQDVAATRALHEWLIEQRPAGLEWREALLEVLEPAFDTDQLVEELHHFGESSAEHLLGDLLNYWRRERAANTTPKFLQAQSDFTTLYGDRDYIANLRFTGFSEGTRGKTPVTYAHFTWPEQLVDQKFQDKGGFLYTGVGVERGYGYLSAIDLEKRTLTMTWRDVHEAAGGLPSVITLDGYIGPRDKPGVLVHLAEQILRPQANDPASRVSLDLLSRARPRLRNGFAPVTSFGDSLEETLSWVGGLDDSYAAIQGPPGTGKTYSGAHIIAHLLAQGQRVGITAMSHAAIDNLLNAAHEVLVREGRLDDVRALRVNSSTPTARLDAVRYTTKPAEAESEAYNLVAGTTWLWSRPGIRAYPVDVLLIDEAGQLALADAIAAANGARNLILLGDPLQLAQVAQAEHPGGSGASVLEHVLGEHATIAPDQGVFLSESRRMHPDVCHFISEQIYEGRLTSHESCAQQTTVAGTGLRWLRATHAGCSTESPEEAEIVVDQIRSLLGEAWTDHHGARRALTGPDFMVVAPYNDQVRLLRRALDVAGLNGVQVGTVDKFQGREAAVVFFTMTTSSHEDMPRGPEFLFSRNRLNVAVSRARCLAYLVCTEELLNARARTIDEMRLIGTLCAFVDDAQGA
jgi:predicted RecB family nuclease